MPIGFATENHETLLDVEHIIGSIRKTHPEVTYIQMPCVNDHPAFTKMCADWAHDQIASLRDAEPLAVNPQLAVEKAAKVHSYSHDHDHNGHHSHGGQHSHNGHHSHNGQHSHNGHHHH
jgi:protoporphyrin/coproporphyrin ferrochelatase